MVKSNTLLQLVGENYQRLGFPSFQLSRAVLFPQTCFCSSKFCVSQESEHESLAPWAFPFDTLQARSLQLAEVLLFFSPFSSDRVICMQFRKHSHREPPKDRQPVYLIANQPTTWFLVQRSNWLGILSVSLADANKQACLLTIYLQNTDWFQERNITSLCKGWANDFFWALE